MNAILDSTDSRPQAMPTGGGGVLRAIARVSAPLSRPLAGRRWFRLWAIVEHRGRRSGRRYATPVAVLPAIDGLIIPLPFGERTQWYRNVLAQGECTMRWAGSDHRFVEPEVIGLAEAQLGLNRFQRAMIRQVGIASYLRLKDASRTPAG
jgi:deazaflavin-dependent oxidoreductase (nitroreductase family)